MWYNTNRIANQQLRLTDEGEGVWLDCPSLESISCHFAIWSLLYQFFFIFSPLFPSTNTLNSINRPTGCFHSFPSELENGVGATVLESCHGTFHSARLTPGWASWGEGYPCQSLSDWTRAPEITWASGWHPGHEWSGSTGPRHKYRRARASAQIY